MESQRGGAGDGASGRKDALRRRQSSALSLPLALSPLLPLSFDFLFLNCRQNFSGAIAGHQRQAFVGHEIQGRSFKEMSAETGVNINTLLARKRYAVLALRLRLQAEYGDLIV